MSALLYNIMITPLELIIEVIYTCSFRVFRNPGGAIIVVSLLLNLFLLPLYLYADTLSSRESKSLRMITKWKEHICSAFHGDEKHFRLNSYYRENGYHPARSLLVAVPLFLQIPFFIAAYHFFYNLSTLSSASFFIITDLSKPDNLLSLSDAISINILPFLMTLVNFLSVHVYSKEQSFREKLRSYLLGLIFLFLLYSAPSGLVIYWTVNNLFSLIKNIVLTHFAPQKNVQDRTKVLSPLFSGFWFLTLLELTLLLGGILPADVIRSSVAEFMNIGIHTLPVHYVLHTLQIYFGLLLFWGSVFWLITPEKYRKFFLYFFVSVLFCLLCEYLFFPSTGGALSNALTFVTAPVHTGLSYMIRNLTVAICASLIAILLLKKHRRIMLSVLIALPIISSVFFLRSVYQIRQESALLLSRRAAEESRDQHTAIPLSRTGKNVIVIGMDRAIGCYIPFLLTERPDLIDSLDGFVWYPNTASFGYLTLIGGPPLFGGYEYTPLEMNRRSSETLVQKTNEALRVMPSLFSDNGYRVTIVDPPLANYMTPGDLSVFDGIPGVNAFRMDGYCALPEEKETASALLERNMVFYSLYRSAPSVLKDMIYDDGQYYNADGYLPPSSFLEAHAVLKHLPQITELTDTPTDTLLLLYNYTAHEPALLHAPDYDPQTSPDGYKEVLPHSMSLGDQTMHFSETVSLSYSVAHYHINMAALLRLAEFFDYLKEEGVWDNTRIIVVADHGWNLGNFDSLKFGLDLPSDNLSQYDTVTRQLIEDASIDIEAFNPLLLYKDFNTNGFSVDYSFMTNADVPSLATNGIIAAPVNPFTRNPITADAKNAGIDIINPDLSDIRTSWTEFPIHNTYVFHVQDNLFDPSNWEMHLQE